MNQSNMQIDLKNIEGIKNLVDEGGYDIEQILSVLNALNAIKKNDAKKAKEGNVIKENKIFLDKEFIYETRDDVYIYRDNRTKKKGYYIRIYDPKRQKHWSKSLKTTNRMVAMTNAEKIYAEKKGRLNFGVRPVSITCRELSALYQKERRKEITNIPHQGITPRSFDTMCQHIKYWEDYIKEEGHYNTKLEDIPTELGLTFGNWIKDQKKKSFKDVGSRNNYTINHTIAAVKKMYRDIAKQKKYITENEMPMFKYLKVNRENKSTRDLITKKEFTDISRWIQYKYCNEKGISTKEQIKRRVYGIVFTLSHYLGCRPKEMLAIKWSDISINPNDDKKDQKINRLIHIPADNSKTGRSRDIIAPIAPQLERLMKWYREFGFEVDEKSNDFIFPRMTYSVINENVPTTDVAWTKRLRVVMKGAEKDGYWDAKGRNITNYSARHHYITEAIQRGVDIYDIALNCGTSINYIEKTYSHVTTLMRSKEITKGLGKHRLYNPLQD